MDTLTKRINSKFGSLTSLKGRHGAVSQPTDHNISIATTNNNSWTSPVTTAIDSVPVCKMDSSTSAGAALAAVATTTVVSTVPAAAASQPQAPGHNRSASGASAGSSLAGGAPAGGAASRSLSMNSVSSEGSNESHLVEQEEIVALTHDVRGFKEALSRLRRIFHPDREKHEVLRVAAHERMGDVLRILRAIIERYPPLQSTELLMAAGHLIQQVKSFNFEDEKCNPTDFFETIDQLALAFSSRVSEYLMGDIDTSSALHPATRTRSCENLLPGDVENYEPNGKEPREPETLAPEEIDDILMKLDNGVNVAFHRAKVWSKYAKDIITYIEKRATLEAEYSRNLSKLAQNIRTNVKEESFLPFQSIYCTAFDQDIENSNVCQMTCTALQEHKFVEPLSSRKSEHERQRKQIKDTWQRELKRTQEAVGNFRKARSQYIQRHQDYEKAKGSVIKAENSEGSEGSKVDKKKKLEEDALQKVSDAEAFYKSCVEIANDRQQVLENTRAIVFKQIRELMIQCDQTMKAVTVCYFQMQHTRSAPAPVQFQTLCESSRLYEPGSQYMEFVKRLPVPIVVNAGVAASYRFEPYLADNRLSDKERRSIDSYDATEDTLSPDKLRNPHPVKAWGPAVTAVLGSDSDSVGSSQSNKSRDTSPSASPQVPLRRLASHTSSGDELEIDSENMDNGFCAPSGKPYISKAAATHTIRKLKTLAKCRECDTYVYFQGVECSQCGLASHKKCLETLAIQCGHKRLPRKMTTFGVDLCAHLTETRETVPPLITKCVREIDRRGIRVKGIYRTSGVKSRVEKLCQSFENGANLVDLSDVHPNVIANVLKLYLRQLPEPLLTYRHYPDFIRVAKEYQLKSCDDEQDGKTKRDLKDIIARLPPGHRTTLTTLVHHLRRISDQCDSNNMPPTNLGIVFGPTLLRTSEGGASLTSLVDTVHQAKVVELLINFATDIFGEDSQQRRREDVSGQTKLHVQVESKSCNESETTQVFTTGSSSFISCERVEESSSVKHHDARTHTESASINVNTKSMVDTGTRSCSTPLEWAGKLGRADEQFFPTDPFHDATYAVSKQQSTLTATPPSKEPVTRTASGTRFSSSAFKEHCGVANSSRTSATAATLDSEAAVGAQLTRSHSTSRKTTTAGSTANTSHSKSASAIASTIADNNPTSVVGSGGAKRSEKVTIGVATQTDASFLRNLWASPAPPPRKHLPLQATTSSSCVSTTVASVTTDGSQQQGHSNMTSSTTVPPSSAAKRSSSSGDVLDRIVIHVAGPCDLESDPPGGRSQQQQQRRDVGGVVAPTADGKCRVQIVRSEPLNSKRAAATMVKSRSEETGRGGAAASDASRGQCADDETPTRRLAPTVLDLKGGDCVHPKAIAAATTAASLRLEQARWNELGLSQEAGDKLDVDDESRKVVHLSVPQNQADQDSGFEDARPSPDCSPSRYISPYLSDDPYKKYRLGTGSPLSVSKTSTFANYDISTTVLRSGAPTTSPLLASPNASNESQTFIGSLCSMAGRYTSDSSLGSSSLKGSSQDSLDEHDVMSTSEQSEPDICSSSPSSIELPANVMKTLKTIEQRSSISTASTVTTSSGGEAPNEISTSEHNSRFVDSQTREITSGQPTLKLEGAPSPIDREPHYV